MEIKNEPSFIPLRTGSQKRLDTAPEGQRAVAHRKPAKTQALQDIQQSFGIETEGEGCPKPFLSFREAGLNKCIENYLMKRGFVRPTAIQMQGLSCLKCGRDVIAISPTGSGKTLAYLIPLVSLINSMRHDSETKGPIGLIVVPTRELMQQISETVEEMLEHLTLEDAQPESFSYVQHAVASQPLVNTQSECNGLFFPTTVGPFSMDLNRAPIRTPGLIDKHSFPTNSYSQIENITQSRSASVNYYSQQSLQREKQYTKSLSVLAVCGGVNMSEQISVLQNKNISVIVATPGRLIDLGDRGYISYKNATYVVLDECDKMLELGMEEQLRKIVAQITLVDKDRQFSLWSATLPESLERLARSAVIDPITIYVGVRDFVNTNIVQNVIFIHTYQKKSMLLKTLRSTPYPPVIVFASTREIVDEITELLTIEQFHVCGLHSHKDQEYRFKVISAFRRGRVDVLVATDLASRGLDIPEVTHVINYDLPDNIEDYIHRCGRTGRFGRQGLATSFLTFSCKIAPELKELLELSNMPIPKQLEDTKQFGGKVLVTDFGDRLPFY